MSTEGELKLQCSIQDKDAFLVDAAIDTDGILGFEMREHPHNGDGGSIIIGLSVAQIKQLMTHLAVALRVYDMDHKL